MTEKEYEHTFKNAFIDTDNQYNKLFYSQIRADTIRFYEYLLEKHHEVYSIIKSMKIAMSVLSLLLVIKFLSLFPIDIMLLLEGFLLNHQLSSAILFIMTLVCYSIAINSTLLFVKSFFLRFDIFKVINGFSLTELVMETDYNILSNQSIDGLKKDSQLALEKTTVLLNDDLHVDKIIKQQKKINKLINKNNKSKWKDIVSVIQLHHIIESSKTKINNFTTTIKKPVKDLFTKSEHVNKPSKRDLL